MNRLYFGHPINVFGTELQRLLLQRIASQFVGWVIVSPNTPEHQAGYESAKRLTAGPNPTAEQLRLASGMHYFLERVVPACQGGVFLPFRDGRWGAGVYAEAAVVLRMHYPAYKISPDGEIRPVLDLRNEPEPLSADETRARIGLPY